MKGEGSVLLEEEFMQMMTEVCLLLHIPDCIKTCILPSFPLNLTTATKLICHTDKITNADQK